MKRIIACLLVFVMILAFAACGNNNEESKPEDSSAVDVSSENTPAESSEPESTPAEESTHESSVEPISEPVSEEPSEPEPELPDYIPGFVYVAGQLLGMRPTDADSIRLTKINDAPEAGDVVCFTPEFGDSIAVEGETYEDYAILVVQYDTETFSYRKKQVINLDNKTDKSNVAIPDDGFVVAIHKDQKKPLAALGRVKDDVEIYPSNFQPKDFSYTVKKTDEEFEIDGVVGPEWDDYLVDEINETNPNWDYRQFEKNNYGITANNYLAYNDKGVYLAVVVNSADSKWMPNVAQNAGGMWAFTCIQVNTCDQSPLSDYMLEHAQGGYDTTAVGEDHLRQYGFSGSADGNSYSCVWMGGSHATVGEGVVYSCIIDPEYETITYEVFFPYEEINIDPAEVTSGFEFSISISINCSSEEDQKANIWKNIRSRNGGGIIGMNEFSKMPVCTIE